MTDVARWQPAKLPRPRVDAKRDMAEKPRRFVSFAFYTIDPGWLRLDPVTRLAGAQELAAVIDGCRDRLQIHSYTTFGLCAETDFLLWRVSHDLDAFEAMAAAMRRTQMGCWLRTPYSYLGMTGIEARRSTARSETVLGGDRFLLVCPLVKTAAWDTQPEEDRRQMTQEILRLGTEIPGAGWDTTYSVGLGAHESLLTFETDRPDGFPELIESLRRMQSSVYAQRAAPIFICIRQEPPATLARISGV